MAVSTINIGRPHGRLRWECPKTDSGVPVVTKIRRLDRDPADLIHDREGILVGQIIADIDRQSVQKRLLLHQGADRRPLRVAGCGCRRNA